MEVEAGPEVRPRYGDTSEVDRPKQEPCRHGDEQPEERTKPTLPFGRLDLDVDRIGAVAEESWKGIRREREVRADVGRVPDERRVEAVQR